MLYNLTDRPHDEKILSSTKNSGLSIKITEDLQSPPATSRRDLSITNQKPIKINDNNLTERYKTPKYDEIINIYKKTPKSLYNYQETFINPQETANVLKSKLQEMHKKLIEPNETESINRNDSKKSTQMNLASPKSDLSNVNTNFLRNGSKKSTRLSASSPKTTKEAYVKDLLSQTSRNSSPPSQHSAETAKPSNPPKRKLIQFPTKLQTQARITVNSSVPLETAYIYKEIIKRRCADDQHFKLTK